MREIERLTDQHAEAQRWCLKQCVCLRPRAPSRTASLSLALSLSRSLSPPLLSAQMILFLKICHTRARARARLAEGESKENSKGGGGGGPVASAGRSGLRRGLTWSWSYRELTPPLAGGWQRD